MVNKEKQGFYNERLSSHMGMFDHVIIDVDSCLAGIEGIDELARLRNLDNQVTDLTKAAMNGEIPFGEVFAKRLEIIQPRLEDLRKVGRLYMETMTPFAPQVITFLRSIGVTVWLISGGYDEAIYPLAHRVGIQKKYVIANHLFFDEAGRYRDFDKTNPLCGDVGKRNVIAGLKKNRMLFGKVAIVGDGMSEVEAKDEVDLCIGFGGHIVRENVRTKADIFITDKTFIPLVPILLGGTRG